MKPILISIAGGSASGKSTVVSKIINDLKSVDITVIQHDDYYNDQTNLSLEKRYDTNYDHPNSLDNNLLIKHLKMLLNGCQIEKPTYDFVQHNRALKSEIITPTKVIILEGILVLENKELRDLSNIKLFVESDDDTRFIRRLQRDITYRGRSVDSVINQYLSTVKPMHYEFVKPSKRYADMIIPNDKHHDVAVDIIVSKIKEIIKGE